MYYRTQVQSLPCLVRHSVTESLFFLFFSNFICQSCYMDFSEFLHGFVKIDTCIYLSCYMDLSKLLHGFVKDVTQICQTCSMFLSPFAKHNQAKILSRFQSFWSFENDFVCAQADHLGHIWKLIPEKSRINVTNATLLLFRWSIWGQYNATMHVLCQVNFNTYLVSTGLSTAVRGCWS